MEKDKKLAEMQFGAAFSAYSLGLSVPGSSN